MVKTPKVKKREVSIHSRAAKRETATKAATKTNLTSQPPVEETEYKPWLHNVQNAGISKKKKVKQLSRQQRLRQQKGLEIAERNIEKHEKKIAESKIRGKKVKARRIDWDELNDKITGKENRNEMGTVEQASKMDEGGLVELDGVEPPDLEQPLPIRVAETEMEADEPELVPVAETITKAEQPAVVESALPVDDLDEVT